jgi:penicillin-insensitive murein endopeptidase
MRTSRNRYYGTPLLVNFLEWLAQQSALNHTGGELLIGDLGQPRGGPMPSGHVSHQVGLDVDVWFTQPAVGQRVTDADRESWGAESMLKPNGRSMDLSKWNDNKEKILELATRATETERIFVNAVIKKYLCLKTGGAAWLQKLRPWPGHDDHFHVRLRCPAGMAQCKPQDPVEPGSGCDSNLDAMLSEASLKDQKSWPAEPDSISDSKSKGLPTLPVDCNKVLRADRR